MRSGIVVRPITSRWEENTLKWKKLESAAGNERSVDKEVFGLWSLVFEVGSLNFQGETPRIRRSVGSCQSVRAPPD